MNGVIPEYAKLIAEVDRPFSVTTPREMLNQGRVLRSITDTPGNRGEEYNIFKEGARLVTGFTPMTLDIRNDFAFAGKAYTPRRTEAKSAAQRDMKRANLTQADMLRSWDTYLDNLYREQSKLYQDIESARDLMPGLSKSRQDTIIRQNLVQGARLGKAEANAIMNGEFWPTDASKELWKDLIRMRQAEGRTFMTDMSDFSPFNQRSRDRKREPLSVASPEPAPRAVPAPMNPLDLLPPGSVIRPRSTQPAINPLDLLPPGSVIRPRSTQPISGPRGQIDPAILGTDPATQALAKSLGRTN
jgi:hypothetical protein